MGKKPIQFFLAALLVLATFEIPAKTVENLEPIARELKIAEDVFQSAMRNSVEKKVRVANVQAQYLVNQGVLVSMDVVIPWIDVDKFSRETIDVDMDIDSLHDIPEMVKEILAGLNIAIAPYDPEALGDLKDLREEQGEVRAEQRSIRSELRDLRRERMRADEDEFEDLDLDIRKLEEEIGRLEQEYDMLGQDVELQYEHLRELRASASNIVSTEELDQAVAETACNYGGTFKSLKSQQFLNMAVTTNETTRFYVFRMEQIHACRRSDIDLDLLLKRSPIYQLEP